MNETMERLGNAYEELQKLQLQPTEHNIRILTSALDAMRGAYFEMSRIAGEEPEAGPGAGPGDDPETGTEAGPEEAPEPGKEDEDGCSDRV